MAWLGLEWQDRGRPDEIMGLFEASLGARVWRDERTSKWMWRVDGKPPIAGTSEISWFGSEASREACVAAVEEFAAEVMESAGLLGGPDMGRKA